MTKEYNNSVFKRGVVKPYPTHSFDTKSQKRRLLQSTVADGETRLAAAFSLFSASRWKGIWQKVCSYLSIAGGGHFGAAGASLSGLVTRGLLGSAVWVGLRRIEPSLKSPNLPKSFLEKGWVIANHILVSFHVAYISSLLSLPPEIRNEVLKFIFFSLKGALISLAFIWFVSHSAIAIHEMGHYLKAVKLDALNAKLLLQAKENMAQPLAKRILWYLKMFALIPTGKFPGVIKNGLNYYPDAPFNLAVAASGPRSSRNLSIIFFPFAIGLISLGLLGGLQPAVYIGRLCLGLATVGLLDFFIADPGKYKEFRDRERRAKEKAQTVEKVSGWYTASQQVKQRMLAERIQGVEHPSLGKVTVAWQFRNCGMGGRHTEKEYPESNISMQEAMFVILGVENWQEAQEMTMRLQNRLKEIIEKEEGSRVMGIGLEGGLAPYIERAQYPLPEIRLWAMMKQAIEECGYQAGREVAIGLDPAMSELEKAYREEYNMPGAVGMYLFWRDKAKISLDRDGVLAIYKEAIQKYEIPIISIEDGFAEDDHQGWKMLLKELGERIWVIGDDLVTTNDRAIEMASQEVLINTSLIKANQIGTLYETILAMLVALGKGQELVISHRSKSPNDDMETQIALAVNALGLKAGGGANTERLFKYQSGIVLMRKLEEGISPISLKSGEEALIRKFFSYEESTNAGIPTVGVEIEVYIPSVGAVLSFKGATPLGTSAGTGEAIHLVDSLIEYADHQELIDRYPDLFQKTEEGVYEFNQKIGDAQVKATQDAKLMELFRLASRYEGKGCLNAVDNVLKRIAPQFEGKNLTTLTLRDIDTTLLRLERDLALERGKLSAEDPEAQKQAMQRKQNLGMNAILSVSLALARAVAHIQGKELYGLIREEIFSIIESLAKDYQVQIKGKEVSDYIAALREVNQILEKQNQPLYEVLREKTKIYAVLSSSPDSAKPRKDFAYFGWTDEQIDRQLAKDAARGIYPEESRTSEEKAYLEKERDIALEHLRLKGIIRSRPPKVLVIYTDELAFGATYKSEENLLLLRSSLINHPKNNLTAVFVHELNGGNQQENEAAELAYSISQDIQESYGVTPAYIRIETQLGPGGRNRGSTILLNAVSVSSGKILRIYLEKSTHGTAEVERSIRASRLGLGPKVIYVRVNTIVEYYAGKDTDLRQRGFQLTSQEQQIVGMRLAEKLYLMFDMTNLDQVAHAFDALSDHLCIVGNGKHIDVIWIDWGRNKFVDVKNRAEQVEGHLQVLVDAIKAFLGPEVCAYFLIRLRELAAQRGEGAFFDELCKNIRKAMTEPEAYNFNRVVLALSYQRFFAQVDAIIERIQGKEHDHPTVSGRCYPVSDRGRSR